MIVAVIAVRMMETTLNQVVDVISVRDCFMAASGAVDMSRLVSRQGLPGGTAIGVFTTDLDPMLVYVITMWMMKVPIMLSVSGEAQR